jgi:hypothetical protein
MTNKVKKIPGKNSYQYKPQWGVLVHCNDEQHQQEIYKKAKEQGLKCKVLAL